MPKNLQKSLHHSYLRQKGLFTIDCSVKIFTAVEIETLNKYGHWFMGLSNGDLEPFTKEQKDFTKIFMNNLLPETEYQKLWFKYLGRKQLELENPEKFKLDYQFKEEGFHTREDYFKLHPYMRNRK